MRAGGQCFSAVEEVYDDVTGQVEPEYSFGCISADQASALLQVSFGRENKLLKGCFTTKI